MQVSFGAPGMGGELHVEQGNDGDVILVARISGIPDRGYRLSAYDARDLAQMLEEVAKRTPFDT